MPLAVRMTRYGPPEVLEPIEVPVPEPGPGEIVIRALVAGVNRADCFIRSGTWPQAGSWPYVPGLEVCGVVHACGAGTTRFRPGDPVITMMQKLGGIHGARPGGYQHYVTTSEHVLVALPDGTDPDTIGTLGLPAVTALAAIEVLSVSSGMRVLVHAGSSAVGQIAIQILRSMKADVVATGTRQSKAVAILSSGATQFVSTNDADWPKRVGPVDRVFDLLGGSFFGPTVGLLRERGRLVFVGGTAGGDLSFSGWDLMRPVTLTGYSSETLTASTLGDFIEKAARMNASAQLRCQSVTRFPLRLAAEAHRALESGEIAGRVVLIPT